MFNHSACTLYKWNNKAWMRAHLYTTWVYLNILSPLLRTNVQKKRLLSKYSCILAMHLVTVSSAPAAIMGRPSSPSRRRGRSLTEGASQIPGTNDSTLRQLKPPHPSHIEGPVSPRCLGLETYPNPCPSSLTIPHNERIKTTPNTSGCGLPRPASFRSGNPAWEHFPIKAC